VIRAFPVGTSMTVNDNGAFYLANDANGNAFTIGARHYTGGTLEAQAAILIHETAHGVTVAGFQLMVEALSRTSRRGRRMTRWSIKTGVT